MKYLSHQGEQVLMHQALHPRPLTDDFQESAGFDSHGGAGYLNQVQAYRSLVSGSVPKLRRLLPFR